MSFFFIRLLFSSYLTQARRSLWRERRHDQCDLKVGVHLGPLSRLAASSVVSNMRSQWRHRPIWSRIFADHRSMQPPRQFKAKTTTAAERGGALSCATTTTPDPVKVTKVPLKILGTWQRREFGLIKVDVDAAISKTNRAAGVGAIVRNYFGDVLGIAIRSFDGIQSPRVAESLAIREELNLALDLKLERVVMESDAESHSSMH
ncbi:hypothetical protein RHMOL_Rhmol07G0164300 [Rhododendron molle]|uniref:Uncharacterized protein n=1 Tax=Rhododendron molle TaxID=49168 RepID=A0ACC0N197_RHOML|nr:hypothetical protein RHMOL_Rhmol07G0164300 [Rhododendron molle]